MKNLIFFIAVTYFVSIKGQPKPKPVEKVSNPSELYDKQHSLSGPLLDALPKKKADKLRRILEDDSLTKGEIDDEVEKWVSSQDPETREKYSSFKRALKVRVLRLKLRHELKIKRLSDEAKKLDEEIQNVIEDKTLTWPETVQAKKELIRKASQKVLKELGIQSNSDDEDNEESVEGEGEDPHDYENRGDAGKFDYTTHNDGFDYNNEDGMHKPDRVKPKSRPRMRPSARSREQSPDYRGDYDH